MSAVTEGQRLWQASPARRDASNVVRYMQFLERSRGLKFDNYRDLWQWSTTELEAFWASLWEFFEIKASAPYQHVLSERRMPGARWFEGAKLNYAEHVFRNATTQWPAMLAKSELRKTTDISWAEFEGMVGATAASLRAIGVVPGDRVVSYMPNIAETVVAFLACASIGAVWSSCSPDMGLGAVLDRFKQIEPKVLFTVDGYRYSGRDFDRSATVRDIVAALPSLKRVVVVPYLSGGATIAGLERAMAWSEVVATAAPLTFTQLDFDHPLWIVYSSGTTGLPKGIVHGHGGVVIEMLKSTCLGNDLHPGDRYFWISSTGWIVWNLLVSGLLSGGTAVLLDGNPAYPDSSALWRFLAATRTTHFGCGAAFVYASMKAGVAPKDIADLTQLGSIHVTGSPLTVEGFAWMYDNVKSDLWVASVSGGTDIASGFIVATLLEPIYAGELQCPALGVAAFAFDEAGNKVVNQVGELVITEPMPSMPLYFWNDPDGKRYRAAYYEMYPGKWRHGDWIRFTERGTSVIYGRSDTTINRHGIRMGTAEIYRAVEDLTEVVDSLVVDLEYLGRESFMPLFVVLQPGATLDAALKERIKHQVRTRASSRHVPNEVYAVAEIPRTLTGKKMELPVRKLLLGAAPEKVASPESMANPTSFGYFVELAKTLNG